jgi:UDP-2,3-diacylglucosamine pyrophosphatase LpxH
MAHYRSIFISDMHVGGACNYTALRAFLRNNDADTWYIVGDGFGLWEVRRSKQWSPEANIIVQKILRKARKGAKFIIIPGNHDEELRLFEGFEIGNIQILDKVVHTTANGHKFLLIHGDVFDSVVGNKLAKIGSVLYDFLVVVNAVLNWFRKLFGMPFWSFSAVVKRSVKHAVAYIGDFETLLIGLAEREGMDGVICGHDHTPAIKNIHGLQYINCGDWVESLSAVVEHDDGQLELLFFTEH